jgi:hypothetical protein
VKLPIHACSTDTNQAGDLTQTFILFAKLLDLTSRRLSSIPRTCPSPFALPFRHFVIQAGMGLIVGAKTLDRLFASIKFE